MPRLDWPWAVFMFVNAKGYQWLGVRDAGKTRYSASYLYRQRYRLTFLVGLNDGLSVGLEDGSFVGDDEGDNVGVAVGTGCT